MKKGFKEINPNSDRDYLSKVDINDEKNFPLFLKEINIETFRNIKNVNILFKHPVTVISGSNRSGKTSVLIAIACSHYDFKKRNPSNGNLERHTWNSMVRFTEFDTQKEDWIYYLSYRQGKTVFGHKKGMRNQTTKKWVGIAKKEGQINNRNVVFIDIDRALPARDVTNELYRRAQNSADMINHPNQDIINKYVSYIHEEDYTISSIATHLNKDAYSYINSLNYSSFNSATGEDAITSLMTQIVESPNNSLILIEEMEVGLHPKIQRRLLDVICNISRNDKKQFIITTHSPTVLSCVNPESRVFLDKYFDGTYRVIADISINAALSKMDSKSYPLVDLYCEDKEAAEVIRLLIDEIQRDKKIFRFSDLVNIIASGPADQTWQNFIVHKRTYDMKKIKVGYACILDGDMQLLKDKNGNFVYRDSLLFFLLGNEAPEKHLVRNYNKLFKNKKLEYHINNSNPHCLFQKMVELGISSDSKLAFNMCWDQFKKTTEYRSMLSNFKNFLINACREFSPDL